MEDSQALVSPHTYKLGYSQKPVSQRKERHLGSQTSVSLSQE